MIVVGVDPGKQGALVALDSQRDVEVLPTPLIAAGKGGRDEYDLVAVAAWLRKVAPGFVVVEKSQPLPAFLGKVRRCPVCKSVGGDKPMGGTIAQYARGVARGWEWMLIAMEIRYQLVAPRTWQNVMHAGVPTGTTKQRSIVAARRLFPDQSLLRTPKCRTLDDGIADALLLADYGHRLLGNDREEPDPCNGLPDVVDDDDW